MSGNMVPGGWRLVLPLLAFGKVALDGLGEVKEHRERMKADEKRKSECEELERKLRTKEDQLIASEARNKTLEDEVRKRRAEEFRPLWRRVWQGFLVKPKDGQLRDALASLLPVISCSPGEDQRRCRTHSVGCSRRCQIILLVLLFAGGSAAKGYNFRPILLLVLFLAGGPAA
ncbi:MAG: hypothetical protein Q9200_003091 [Gallowayella weberi]